MLFATWPRKNSNINPNPWPEIKMAILVLLNQVKRDKIGRNGQKVPQIKREEIVLCRNFTFFFVLVCIPIFLYDMRSNDIYQEKANIRRAGKRSENAAIVDNRSTPSNRGQESASYLLY